MTETTYLVYYHENGVERIAGKYPSKPLAEMAIETLRSMGYNPGVNCGIIEYVQPI